MDVAKVTSETPSSREDGLCPWSPAGTVLVVDDEEGVRKVTQRMLEKTGFDVITASDGRTAVDLLRMHARDISVVLLDMAMPGMDGKETYSEMRKIRSDVKVVLMSGYNEEQALMGFAAGNLVGFVRKPFDTRQLLDTLWKLLAPVSYRDEHPVVNAEASSADIARGDSERARRPWLRAAP